MPQQNPRRRAAQAAAKEEGFASPGGQEPAKKSTRKRSWKTEFKAGFSGFLEAQATEAENKMGHRDSLVGTDAERVVIGLPLKSFSLQLLYSSTVYPLGRMEMLIGESDSCKTAFLFEKMRWFLRDLGGGFVYLLNEGRDPADLRNSIIRDVLQDPKSFRLEGPCESLEDWQRRTTGWLHRFEAGFKRTGGTDFPLGLGLDSITGTTNENAIRNIDEEGCAKLTFGQDANLLNQYAKYLFQRLYRWPISFICTNHIKFGSDRYGNKVMRIPGGDELRYVSTYITLLTRSKDIDRLDVAGGRRLVVKTMKSMGDRREVPVDFVWTYGPDGTQTSLWDWHSASVEYLLNITGERAEPVKEIIEFTDVVKTQRTCRCPALGIRDKRSFNEVGSAIMHDAKVLEALQNHFGIRRRAEFRAGVPYCQQIEDAIVAGSTVVERPADITGAHPDAEDHDIAEVPVDEQAAPAAPTEVGT